MDFSSLIHIFDTINLLGLFAMIFIIFCLQYNMETSKRERFTSVRNGPKTIPFFGNTLNFILHPKDITTTLIHYSKKYGSRYRLWIGRKLVIVIGNPEDAEAALMGNKFLNKGSDFHDLFGRVFKNGTFSAEGADWKKSRKIIQHPLKTNVLDDYRQVMSEEAVSLMKNLQLKANITETFDIVDYIAPTTFNIICRALFNLEETATKEDHQIFREASASYLGDSFELMFQPKLVRKIMQTIARKKHEDVFNKMEWAYHKAIAEGKLNGKQKDKDKTDESNKKFIEYLLDESFSHEDRKAEIVTYSVGGSETLSATISFVILMLGMHQKIQDKVYDELERIFGGDMNKNVTMDDIKQMNYLEQVIKEVMRLFPLVPFVFRTASENTTLGDLKIAAGTELIFDATALHYDSKYFPDPETFDPERFSDERSKLLPKGSFFSFAIGPRNCIAKAYAWYEMKIICSTILRKYRIHTTLKREDIKLKYFFVTCNANKNIISISERN